MDALLLNNLCGKTIQQVEWDAEDNYWVRIHLSDGKIYEIGVAGSDYDGQWIEIKELN